MAPAPAPQQSQFKSQQHLPEFFVSSCLLACSELNETYHSPVHGCKTKGCAEFITQDQSVIVKWNAAQESSHFGDPDLIIVSNQDCTEKSESPSPTWWSIKYYLSLFDTREPKHLWLAQTAETLMTTMCPWILALRHSALPRLTVLRISTSLWALGPITLTSQDSLQHYQPVRVAVPPCVTGLAVLVMSPHHPSTATSNLTGNVSFWQQRLHWSTLEAWRLFHCFTYNSSLDIIRHVLLVVCLKTMTFVDIVGSRLPQQSQHLLIWRTMGSLMSCHLRARSPCPGPGPCESNIHYLGKVTRGHFSHTPETQSLSGADWCCVSFPPHGHICFAAGLPWIPCPPSIVDPFLHKASPAPTLQTVRRIMWLWWVPIAKGGIRRAHCVLCFNDPLVFMLRLLSAPCVSEHPPFSIPTSRTQCLPPQP